MTDTRLPEDVNWIRSTEISRRGAILSGAFAAGFALAAQPIAASAFETDSAGLDEGMLTVPVAGFDMPAYRARPAGKSGAPVILVVHEIFGVHAWIKDIARRLAHQGYYAIAPDLYARQGDATKEPDFKKLIANIVSKVPDAQVMSDLDAAVAFAGGDGGDASRLGITGFCWGGRIVWLYAAHNADLDAGVAWYGRLTGETNDLQTSTPLQHAAHLQAPVLGLYGAKDEGIPMKDVEAMRAALEAADSPSKIIVYPEADHGFLADYRPSYHEASAKQAWDEALGWFKQHLRA